MEEKIVKHIKQRLTEIEKEHNVEIMYAIESGSRAWGFESTDSDYDVRFIYRHAEEWYLHVKPKRDVIEYPIVDEFDYAGWDLRKTMFLLNKSNPVLFEWLRSPIVYIKNDIFFEMLKQVSEKYFSKISTAHHYLHMAERNYREYLKKDQVKIKKYFYVLRPVLARMWIEKYNEFPPIEFEKLLKLINSNESLYSEILSLLERKRAGVELDLEDRVDVINNFIENKFEHFTSIISEYKKQDMPGHEVLDAAFRNLLRV